MKRGIIIAAAVIAACGAAVAAAAMNTDKLLMRFAPELYLSYIAVNTVNELEAESELINKAMPAFPKLSESHKLTLDFDGEEREFSLTEEYNEEAPSVVFNGVYENTQFDGYINNTETGICLPELLDLYFTFSTENFGDEFNDSGAGELLPVSVPRGLSLTLPASSEEKAEELLTRSQLMSIGKKLAEGAKIRNDAGDDYFLILNGENVKAALSELVSALLGSEGFNSRLSRADAFLNIGISDFAEYARTLVENADFGETVTVGFTQTKNYASRVSVSLPFDGTNLNIELKSTGARLLDDYTIAVKAESGGSGIGFEYAQGGSRMFAGEEKNDTRTLKIIFGSEELLRAETDIRTDKNNTSLAGSFNITSRLSEDFGISAKLEGAPVSDRDFSSGLSLNIYDIDDGTGSRDKCTVQLTPPEGMRQPERDKYPFKDIPFDDIAVLARLKG